MRILGVLIEGETPMIEKEIIKHADISRPAFHDHCDQLVEFGFVEREERDPAVAYELADTRGVELVTELNDFLDWQLRDHSDLEALISDLHY